MKPDFLSNRQTLFVSGIVLVIFRRFQSASRYSPSLQHLDRQVAPFVIYFVQNNTLPNIAQGDMTLSGVLLL